MKYKEHTFKFVDQEQVVKVNERTVEFAYYRAVIHQTDVIDGSTELEYLEVEGKVYGLLGDVVFKMILD